MSTTGDEKFPVAPNERFIAALQALRVSYQAFATATGVTRSFISEISNKKKPVGLRVVVALSEHYGVSASWVLCGQGAMFLRDLKATGSASDLQPGQTVPPLAADVEARWGVLVDEMRRDGLDLLQEAARAAPPGGSANHPLYDLVDRLLEQCPETEIARVEGYLEATLTRCSGTQEVKTA